MTERVEAECARLVTGFANAVDHRDYDGVLRLFTTDGVFARVGGEYVGHEEIRAYLDSRATRMTNRHLISNFQILREAEKTADGIAYYTVYRVLEAEPARGGKPLESPTAMSVGEFLVRFRRTAEGWRLAKLEVFPVFARQV